MMATEAKDGARIAPVAAKANMSEANVKRARRCRASGRSHNRRTDEALIA